MYLLDTDYMTFLGWPESPAARKIRDRLLQEPSGTVGPSIISFEEQTRGWLDAIRKAKSVKDEIVRYRELNRMLGLYRSMNVLDYDERSAIEFQNLRKSKLRIGSMDLKIAAIALSNQAVLLTRNRGDFIKIPGLNVEDWTQE